MTQPKSKKSAKKPEIDLDTFYVQVKNIYNTMNGKYVYVDLLRERYFSIFAHFDGFYDELYKLYQNGKIVLSPGRKDGDREFLDRDNRIYTTMTFLDD